MLNFELCYEIGNSQKYIIPELLPEKSTADKDFLENENVQEKDLLHFEYRYDFMPKGIISHLIVRMNKYIHNKQQWKESVVLKNEGSLSEIIENYNEGVLRIRIAGNDRLEALAVIREKINDLHSSFEDLKPYEMVPCNCEECKKNETPNFFDYNELRQYKQEGEKYIKCRVGRLKDVNVLSLISDVFIKEKEGRKDESREKFHIEFKPNIVTHGGDAHANASADVDVNIAIHEFRPFGTI